jgi:hypothetical protein
MCLGMLPSIERPGYAIFRQLSKFKQSNIIDTRHGGWCKSSGEHDTIKLFLKLSYPIRAFDRRLHRFLKWFRHQRYMAPALWDEISWALRILLHHNVITPIDTKTFPVDLSYSPAACLATDSDDEEDDDEEEEEEEEEEVAETLFDSVERFKKYIFFLIQGSEGPMTNEEICLVCKRETGLFPRQHIAHLAIQESFTGFICKHLSSQVETTTDGKVISHSLRAVPQQLPPPHPPTQPSPPPPSLAPPPAAISSLKKETSASSQTSDRSTLSSTQQHTPSEFQTVTFTSLEEFAEFIYSVIQKTHPVRNDVISAACRTETGVYPRHHFKELGYDAFLTKFIRTFLRKSVVSKKCDNGDWVHDIMTAEAAQAQGAARDSIETYPSSDDPNDANHHSEGEAPATEATVSPPSPTSASSTSPSGGSNGGTALSNEEGLSNLRSYFYSVIRSFSGPMSFPEINAQCLHDLDASASTLLENLGYHDKFLLFLRTHLEGFVAIYQREGTHFYFTTPKPFPTFTPMKLIKTYPLSTLSLFAEFVYTQVVGLGGLSGPVSYRALDTRCVEVLGSSLQQILTGLEWRSAPSKFLAAYPSGRLTVLLIDGVTCVRVKTAL